MHHVKENTNNGSLGLFILSLIAGMMAFGSLGYAPAAKAAISCDSYITANVVVLDNPTVFNRLGAQNPNWITYALERDVVHWDDGNPGDSNNGKPCSLIDGGCTAGKVQLRPDKRARPLVVRSVAGSCLTVNFKNLLDPIANPNNAQLNTENPAFPVDAPGFEGDPTVDCTADPDNRVCILNNNDQVAGRCAGFHASGTELVNSMADDGSMVGANPGANIGDSTNNPGAAVCGPGLAEPGGSRTYELYTPHEGAFIINSYGATLGAEGNAGNLGIGMLGGLFVQPPGAKMYRGQLTEEEMRLATVGTVPSDCTFSDVLDPGPDGILGDDETTVVDESLDDFFPPIGVHGVDCNPGGQPIIDYEAVYPTEEPWISEGKAGLPILNMLTAGNELVHSDINAIIAGGCADGSWECKFNTPEAPYPLERAGKNNPQLPNRLEPFREFASIWHDEQTNSQVFPRWYGDPVLGHTLHPVGDAFMINYGSGGIGSEIIANRLHTGPMHDCTDCAYEEFFLASQTVGDPGMLVNYPANTGIESCAPNNILDASCWRQFAEDVTDDGVDNPIAIGANPPIPGNYALFPADPGNLHHAYVGDAVKIRNIHAGAFEQHVFHLHNHQWLFNPDDDNANYLDAQEVMPGSGHTYELVNGGAGNRNRTAGDAIFHCHFYPHFAQGMWYHIRIKDVFEKGTVLAVSGGNAENPGFHVGDADPEGTLGHGQPDWALRSGKPAVGARAQPDGELPDGTPIPAIVPLPGKPMPQMPAKVTVAAVDRGDFGVLSGRRPPNGLLQGPDSAQAIVVMTSVAGADRIVGTADDVSPGFPFWLAGNSCGEDGVAVIDLGPDMAAGGGDDRFVATDCPEGIVGQRMATPPLDMLTEAGAIAMADPLFANVTAGQAGGWDGGLPRHALRGYTSGGLSLDTQNRLDFRKIIEISQPVYFPETGTPLEKVSMNWHAVRERPTAMNLLDGSVVKEGDPIDLITAGDDGVADTTALANSDDVQLIPVGTEGLGADAIVVGPGPNGILETVPSVDDDTFAGGGGDALVRFGLNGAPPVPGGPFNDPCIDDAGTRLTGGVNGEWFDGDGNPATLATRGGSNFDGENPRTYKIANVQIDAVFNKVGHHYPQERIIALWEDVAPTIAKQRPPEPLVMRFNTFDCAKLQHTNLVPHEFELDDFQVRTPTDIIGQHIHLPKWDLTTNDGAANGWNYEDGALAPAIVVERVHAINNYNKLFTLPFNASLADGADGTFNGTVVDAAFELGFAAKVHPDVVAELQANNAMLDLAGLAPVATIDTGDTGSVVEPGQLKLHAEPHPFFGTGAGGACDSETEKPGEYCGARTVLQRFMMDPVVNVAGVDRGLGLTFSHDHYGPSTFQQIGLYSTILAEPAGSTWVHNESGELLGTRHDGGPTTWQAAIITPDAEVGDNTTQSHLVKDHREFYFEMSDFQHAYNAGTYVGAGPDGRPILTDIDQPDPFNATVAFAPAIQDTWQETVNPPLKVMHNGGFPAVVVAKGGCPGPAGKFDPSVPRPCAEAINISHSSTWVVNYRNEPVGLRVFDPDGKGPDGQNGTQAAGLAGDLAFALQSRGDREIPQLNTSFGDTPYPTNPGYCQGSNGDLINCDRKPGDPFTPIMRAFENDEVKIKIQVGATEEQHQATVHGVKWLSNGSAFGRSPNSGWRNFQSHGISEQFSLQVPMTSDPQQIGQEVDYFYATDATREGMWLGTWGILRSYGQNRSDLFELPDNPQQGSVQFVNGSDFNGVCPTSATVVPFDVVAVLANEALPNAIDVDGTDGPDITINPNTQIIDQDTGMVLGGDSDGDGVGDNVGGPLDPNGGTLVYNRRGTVVLGIDSCTVEVEEGQSCEEAGGEIIPGVDRAGPLNDPTAMMYVRLEDLVPGKAVIDTVGNMEIGQDEDGNTVYGVGQDGIDDRCQEAIAVIDPADPAYDPTNPPYDINLTLEGCPVKVAATAPVEPLVLRANAGQCLEVTLHNKLIDQAQAANKPVYSCENDGYGGCLDNTYEPLFEAEEAQTADYDPGLLLADAYGAPVALDDVVFDQVPDLAGWQDLMWGVTRRIQPGDVAGPLRNPNANDQMYFFNNNLIRPSGYVGLYSQLVASDTSRDNGVLVGNNSQQTLAAPGGLTTYRWYAGDLKQVAASRRGGNQRRFEIVATPIEFGGSNLLSADRIKQPQKGLFGALSILPEGTTDVDVSTLVPDGQGSGSATRGTRAQATITSPSGVAESGGVFRENLLIGHKLGNLRWADGSAIQNYEQSDLGVEGAEDSGHAGFNYGMEPSWFRFKLDPDAPAGNAGEPNSYGSIPNPQAFYANKLVETELNSIPAITTIDGVQVSKAGDPQTPVFRASAGQKTRIHVLNGASADRDGTFILHGHLWQRDPFVCTSSMYSTNGYLGDPEDATVSLEGRCTPKVMHDDPGVASSALGLNPQGKWMGGEEGMGHVYGHWPILFDAGGTGQVQGDYLYRDYAPNGNRNGQFGILRVEAPQDPPVVEEPPPGGGGNGGGKPPKGKK